jgi:galactose mutarotase-like enzyme
MIRLVSPDGSSSAAINPVGAALAELWFGDNQIAGAPDVYSGVTMFPWPNRIVAGTWRYGEELLALRVNDKENQSALHGLVYSERFDWIQEGTQSCKLSYQLTPSDGYPFQVRVEVSYLLKDGELGIRQTVYNESTKMVPFAIGIHPYFKADSESQFESSDRSFRLGDVHVDETLGPDLHRAILTTRDYSVDLVAEGTDYIHIFTNRYSTPGVVWFAIEPQSSPPDSLNTGFGVTSLEPGSSASFTYRLVIR